MANPTYDSFVNNERNPFVEQQRRTATEEGARDRERLESLTTGKAMPVVDESENDEEAPNSGFVIHVATEPGKGKALDWCSLLVAALIIHLSRPCASNALLCSSLQGLNCQGYRERLTPCVVVESIN